MEKAEKRLSLDRPATYQIRVPGHLDESRSDCTGGMTITITGEDNGPPIITLTGILDQAALQGLLGWLYIPRLAIDIGDQ